MAQKSKQTMKELLEIIDSKIEHIEDISADNRAIIVKLVKQSNQIVEFLKSLQIEEISDPMDEYLSLPSNNSIDKEKVERLEDLNKFLSEYSVRRKELKEFEEELKEVKNQLTPGIIGEA